MAALAALLLESLFGCQRLPAKTVASPNGLFAVVERVEICGFPGADAFETLHVRQTARGGIDVEVFSTSTSGTSYLAHNVRGPTAEWTGERRLLITINRLSDIFLAKSLAHGVTIDYRFDPAISREMVLQWLWDNGFRGEPKSDPRLRRIAEAYEVLVSKTNQ